MEITYGFERQIFELSVWPLAIVSKLQIKIFNADCHEHLGSLSRHTSLIRIVDFSPAARFLVSGGADKLAMLWGIELMTHVRDLGHEHPVWKVYFSTGDFFVTNDTYGCIRKWDVATGINVISIEVQFADIE